MRKIKKKTTTKSIKPVKKIKSKPKKKQELKISVGAAVLTPGSSIKHKTGDWRSMYPDWDKKKCTQCMACWMYCPDDSIPVKNKKPHPRHFYIEDYFAWSRVSLACASGKLKAR